MLMRTSFRSVAAAAMLLVVSALPLRAQEAPLRVIVNAHNPVTFLARADVSKMFFKRVDAWKSGDPVVPVDQVEDADIRKLFSKRVLGRDVKAVKGYWRQAIFTGKSFPPVEKGSDAEVAAFVAANANAIGYVSAAAILPSAVKVVRVND
jgi:ABC-type phosphate transport system substrate-binding protein